MSFINFIRYGPVPLLKSCFNVVRYGFGHQNKVAGKTQTSRVRQEESSLQSFQVNEDSHRLSGSPEVPQESVPQERLTALAGKRPEAEAIAGQGTSQTSSSQIQNMGAQLKTPSSHEAGQVAMGTPAPALVGGEGLDSILTSSTSGVSAGTGGSLESAPEASATQRPQSGSVSDILTSAKSPEVVVANVSEQPETVVAGVSSLAMPSADKETVIPAVHQGLSAQMRENGIEKSGEGRFAATLQPGFHGKSLPQKTAELKSFAKRELLTVKKRLSGQGAVAKTPSRIMNQTYKIAARVQKPAPVQKVLMQTRQSGMAVLRGVRKQGERVEEKIAVHRLLKSEKPGGKLISVKTGLL